MNEYEAKVVKAALKLYRNSKPIPVAEYKKILQRDNAILFEELKTACEEYLNNKRFIKK